nr:Crp/Fnr family transcriptional regulator [Novosphingobium sp. THN1]
MHRRISEAPWRQFRRYEHLARGGDRSDCIYCIKDGWACRYALLRDGRRQITALYLPGDYCEPHWLLSGQARLPVMALTRLTARPIPLGEIDGPGEGGVRNVLREMVQTLDRQAQWITRLGRKNATERIVELLADLRDRLGSDEDKVVIPLTQREIADIVGLTPVHVNRVLHRLAEQGGVYLRGRSLLASTYMGRLNQHDTSAEKQGEQG